MSARIASQADGWRTASSSLSANLQELGFQVGRFKTGTPCRLNARSIDFSRCSIQLGDEPPRGFAFNPEEIGTGVRRDLHVESRSGRSSSTWNNCPAGLLTRLQKTHEIIRANLAPIAALRRSNSRESGRDIAPRLKIRSSNSRIKPRISSFSNPKDAIPASTT